MAGKTLTGIGEDESGKHVLAADASHIAPMAHVAPVTDVANPELAGKSADKTPSVRVTDKMPFYAGPSGTPTLLGAVPMVGVDEDKVAEGLKKLRSLDEPLGPIPTAPLKEELPAVAHTSTKPQTLRDGMPALSPGPQTLKDGVPAIAPGPQTLKEVMPAVALGPQTLKDGMPALRPGPQTLKEGMPVVGGPAPSSAGPGPTGTPTLKDGMPAVGLPAAASPAATAAAAAAAALIRSRGTALGHALSAGVTDEGRLPVSLDERMKGTLLGHQLHLPDLPAVEDDTRPAEVRPVAATPAAPAPAPKAPFTTESMPAADFPHGDSPTFDSVPIADELEPQSQRGKLIARSAIFLAVLSVCLVAAIAWVRVRRGGDSSAPVEVHVALPGATTAIDNSALGGAPAAPPTEPAAAAVPPAPAPPAGEAPPAPPAAAEAAIAPPPVAPAGLDEARPSAPPAPRAKPKHHDVAPPGGVAKPAAPHAAHAAPPPPTKSTNGKRTKDEDPDGTLPLTE
jgi:hypothetical protein